MPQVCLGCFDNCLPSAFSPQGANNLMHNCPIQEVKQGLFKHRPNTAFWKALSYWKPTYLMYNRQNHTQTYHLLWAESSQPLYYQPCLRSLKQTGLRLLISPDLHPYKLLEWKMKWMIQWGAWMSHWITETLFILLYFCIIVMKKGETERQTPLTTFWFVIWMACMCIDLWDRDAVST